VADGLADSSKLGHGAVGWRVAVAKAAVVRASQNCRWGGLWRLSWLFSGRSFPVATAAGAIGNQFWQASGSLRENDVCGQYEFCAEGF